MRIRVVCVAAPDHPLHALGRPLTREDLPAHRHLVIRDSSALRTRSGGWLNELRWTVSYKATSMRAVLMGLGYAWYPEENMRDELRSGALKALPIARSRREVCIALSGIRGSRIGGSRNVAPCGDLA